MTYTFLRLNFFFLQIKFDGEPTIDGFSHYILTKTYKNNAGNGFLKCVSQNDLETYLLLQVPISNIYDIETNIFEIGNKFIIPNDSLINSN